GVADVGVVVLVVGGKLGRPPHGLAVGAVPDHLLDPDHDGLVHGVGHDHPGPDLPRPPLGLALHVLLRRAHCSSSSGTYSAPVAASSSIRASCAASANEVPFFSPRAWASRDSARACSSARASTS